MNEIFCAVSILTCLAMWIVIRTLLNQARDEGYKAGYKNGTYDALKTDIAARTAFPRK